MRRLVPPVVAALALLAGCGGGEAASGTGASGGGDASTDREPVTAAAAVFPLAWLAQEIAPDAEVEFLGAGSQEAHELDLTPGQRSAVESADVVLYLGDIGYQPQIEEAAVAATGSVVDVASVVGPDRLRPAAEDPHAHEEEAAGTAGGAAVEDEHAAEAELGEGAVDPHVWFDAAAMAEVATRVGEAFAEVDPEGAATYRANAEQVREELLGVAGEVEQVLGGECRFDEAIVSHAAYGYLLDPFGHGQHALVGVTSGEGGASGAQLAEIVAEVRAEGFTHVLAEPVEGRGDAETVAREAGVELLEVYPLDVVSEEQAERGYPDLLREQARTFSTALGCS